MGSPAMRGRCNGGLRWYFNFIQWEPDELEIVRAFASIQGCELFDQPLSVDILYQYFRSGILIWAEYSKNDV